MVIPTRNRREDFADCVRAIAPQVDMVITIAHGDEAWDYVFDVLDEVHAAGLLKGCTVIPYEAEVPNISKMWNLGLGSAPYAANGYPYYVAVLNDDVVVPPGWFDTLVHAMWVKQAVAASHDNSPDMRMAGYAFVLDSKARLLADEQFQWWFGDTDLERQAQRKGGVVKVPGLTVEHRHPNSTTVGELAVIASEDAKRFAQKWHLTTSV